MKKSGFLKGLIVLLVLVLVGGGAVYWAKVAPVMADLKGRDPEKFAAMIVLAKSFDFKKAMENYVELDRMSYENILTVRYNVWKNKRERDEEFRSSHWENELALREDAMLAKKEERQNQLRELTALSEKRPGSALLLDWKNSGAWEKGLLLREKCIKFLEAEKSKNHARKKIHKLSRAASLLEKPNRTSLTIPEICEEWVPISHDEAQVVLALESLKNKMDYFFFVQLLDEIGVPRQDVFSLPSQLGRMTGGFVGS